MDLSPPWADTESRQHVRQLGHLGRRYVDDAERVIRSLSRHHRGVKRGRVPNAEFRLIQEVEGKNAG
jgi:hypothetical protein